MKLQSEVKQKGILAVRIIIKTKSIAKDRMYRPTLLYVFLCINTPLSDKYIINVQQLNTIVILPFFTGFIYSYLWCVNYMKGNVVFI
ncbi:hypothetical protein D5477_16880 [Salmonella enterica]|nr:hypothetical protein [Salmonella enterica]